MSLILKRFFLPSVCCCIATVLHGQQQFQPAVFSVKTALNLVETRFGEPGSSMWVAEVRGTGGRPQPARWEVIGFKPNSPGLLQSYTVQPGVALDAGPKNNRYPQNTPNGYFSTANLRVDSTTAFTLAENEATKARMGFSRCDFLLRAKEYSREPIWELSLIDVNQQIVGLVHISGTKGTVLRTIWVQKGTISGYPKIVDSMAPDFIVGSADRPQIPVDRPIVVPQNPAQVQPQVSQPRQQPPLIDSSAIPPPPDLSNITSVPAQPAPRTSGSIFKNRPPEETSPTAKVVPAKPSVIDDTTPPIRTQKPTSTKRISAPTVPGGR